MKSLKHKLFAALMCMASVTAFAQGNDSAAAPQADNACNSWKDTKDGFYKEIFMEIGRAHV